MQDIYKQLLEEGIRKEDILLNEPMNKHTSFKTGGNADIFVKAYSVEMKDTVQGKADKLAELGHKEYMKQM